MSLFLPEGSQAQPSDGVASITPANPETTTQDIALMQRVLSAASRNPNLMPSDFMAYLIDYIQTSNLSIPIGQIFGYNRNVFHLISLTSISAPVSVTAVTEAAADTVITAPAYAADGRSTVEVRFMAPTVVAPAGITSVVFVLFVDGVAGGWIGVITNSSATNGAAVPVYLTDYVALPAGSHTLSVRAFVTSGTGTVQAGLGGAGNYGGAVLSILGPL